jgi:hypothetical protein
MHFIPLGENRNHFPVAQNFPRMRILYATDHSKEVGIIFPTTFATAVQQFLPAVTIMITMGDYNMEARIISPTTSFIVVHRCRHLITAMAAMRTMRVLMHMRNRTLKLLYRLPLWNSQLLYRLRLWNSHFRNSIASASYVKLLSQNHPVGPTVQANVPATATVSFRRRPVGFDFGYGGWGATRTFITARVDGLPSAGGVFLSPPNYLLI